MARTGQVQNFEFDKEVFGEYMQEQSCLNNLIINSGIIVNDPLVANVETSGNVGSIPYFGNIDDETEALNFDGVTNNTPTALKGGKQTYMAVARMKAWKDTDFVRYLTGKSPLDNLANRLVVPYYTNQWELVLCSILKGALGAVGMESHVTDLSITTGTITDANKLDVTTYIDAGQKALGDRRNVFSLFIAHSQVVANLKKKELISYRTYSDPNGIASYQLPMYGNMLVLETDTNTVDTSVASYPVYTSYMVGAGAFLGSVKDIPNPYSTAYDAEDAGGVNKLYTKQARVLHPNGLSMVVDNIVAESPTNAELATPANWTLKFNHKLVALACIKSNG